MPAISRPSTRRSLPPPGLAVVAGCWAVHRLADLPPPVIGRGLLAAGLLLWIVLLPWRTGVSPQPAGTLARRTGDLAAPILLLVAVAMAAAGWALTCAQARLDTRLAPRFEGVDLRVIGVVDAMPQRLERGQRFRFVIEACADALADCPAPLTAMLGWYRPGTAGDAAPAPAVRPGERWRLVVRLKRPHSTLNPGLFDAELRALEEGVDATGSVRHPRAEPAANRRIDAFVARPGTVIERVRDTIRAAMSAALEDASPAARGVIVALAVGDQAAIPGTWWERFNRTGVGHLMSISGLHITMLAALGGKLAGMLWSSQWLARRMRGQPLPSRIATAHARWAAGLATGFGYAALAGWGIPAQRTCWMLAIAGLAVLSGRARSTVPVLSSAAAIVCVLDPWAPMAAGFWLSFAAVGAIIWFGSQRRRRPAATDAADWRARAGRLLREALRSQVAATLALLPLGVVFFASVSLVGPVANAFAIPLVSAVITPLAIAGAALALPWAPLGAPPLRLASALTDWLLAGLHWIDFDGAAAVAIAHPGTATLLLAVVACGVLLAPLPLPGRWIAGLGVLPLLFAPADRLAPAEIRIMALDVGQGTAVLVETAQGRLLYDAGPDLMGDADAGTRTIVPYLRARGIDRLQALVVSHQDIDHSGGALAVLRGLRVDWVASSLPASHPVIAAAGRHHACRRGERWRWGEVEFDWLHPGDENTLPARSQTNARSCVLRVRSAAGSALLTGDIEAAQEKHLLELHAADDLRADVLIVPHHGSRTSSTPAFLDAVAPQLAVFQLGYRNHFRHPHPTVIARYQERGIAVLRSDADAAIALRLAPGVPPRVERLRVDQRRYWHVRLDEDRNGEPLAR